MKTTPQSIFNTAGTGSAADILEGISPTGTNTYFSQPWSAPTYGLQIVSTGTLTGTLTLWMSDKVNPDRTAVTDWVQDSGFSPTNPAGSAVNFRDDVTNANARWKMIRYVNASGTGTLKGFVTGQD